MFQSMDGWPVALGPGNITVERIDLMDDWITRLINRINACVNKFK
jgi:hypothetical protein